jgi:aminomethyltransferase
MKRTPFYQCHVDDGAKIVPFAGFEMPVQYAGIKKEHLAVRNQAGLFDVSHMGEVFISGSSALEAVQKLTVNDASKLFPGRVQYSAMCYEDGGIVDDLLVYCIAEQEYMLVINASNIEKDTEWMMQHIPEGTTLENRSDDMCLLALQGPKSAEILAELTDAPVHELKYYHFTKASFCGASDIIISATGYTGEKGFEIYFDKNVLDPTEAWTKLKEAGKAHGLEPAGLGARDTLRLEKGFALYGNDISQSTNPLEAGLGWITKLGKEDFVGKDALVQAKEIGLSRKLVGFVTKEPRAIPRQGYQILNENGDSIGEVTSGGQSIMLGQGIGMGYVKLDYAQTNTPIKIQIRNKVFDATVTKPPFV